MRVKRGSVGDEFDIDFMAAADEQIRPHVVRGSRPLNIQAGGAQLLCGYRLRDVPLDLVECGVRQATEEILGVAVDARTEVTERRKLLTGKA
jgi:hypothetical protein